MPRGTNIDNAPGLGRTRVQAWNNARRPLQVKRRLECRNISSQIWSHKVMTESGTASDKAN